MRLLSLHISNFKGIGNFNFIPDGSNAVIYGGNATGKTSIMDALSWLLSDKDSQNQANFSIKPIGGMKKGANVEVHGNFKLGDDTIVLKKIYTENWTKKRGTRAEEFSGNTTEYFVDNIPVRKNGFNEKVQQIGDPGLFRALSCPRHINEELPWQKRRERLLDVCGDIDTEAVIASNPDFGRIPGMIGKKTPEEYRLELEYKKKGVNKELKEIPARIDELQKSLPETSERPDIKALEAKRHDIESTVSVKRNVLSMIESGGSVGAKKKEILDIENEIGAERQASRKKFDGALDKKQSISRFCEESLDKAKKRDRDLIKHELKKLADEVSAEELGIIVLREQWHKKNAETFKFPDTCPTCGQEIPKEQQQTAMENFNTAKAEALANINQQGLDRKKKVAELKKRQDTLNKDLEAAEHKIDALQQDLTKARAEITEFVKNGPHISEKEKELLSVRSKLESELSDLQAGSRNEKDQIYGEIGSLNEKLVKIDADLADIRAAEKTRTRISELYLQEKNLSAEFERIEQDLMLLEEFTRAKCDMLTEKINSKFNLVKWVLFEDQINGGLKDTCIATVDGVPYPDLNNAMKINAGLEIIEVLSEHYGFRLPVFVDNAESIVEVRKINSQVFQLVVSGKDKKLRVEIDPEDKNQELAA